MKEHIDVTHTEPPQVVVFASSPHSGDDIENIVCTDTVEPTYSDDSPVLQIEHHMCETCSYEAPTFTDLEKHIQIYQKSICINITPEERKVFKCDSCGLKYSLNIQLKKHIERLHKLSPSSDDINVPPSLEASVANPPLRNAEEQSKPTVPENIDVQTIIKQAAIEAVTSYKN